MPSDPSSSSTASDVEERLLLFLPKNGPSTKIAEILRTADVHLASFTSLQSLVDAVERGAGTLIVDERAITERASRLLVSAMAQREPWSNLPIIVLTSGTPEAIERLDRLNLFGPETLSNVTILERPVHEVTLKTVVRSALRARRRQYEVRNLMQDLQKTNEQLRESRAALEEANETLEERVEARTQQVRELALELTTAEQQERKRISKLLHDHLQQLIHGARIWAESLAENHEDAPEALERLLDLLDDATETTRSLTAELTPPVLQEKGFSAALEWLSEHVADTHDFHLETQVSPELRISEEDLQILLFRSVRELVFNTIKHAGVDRAHLQAERTNDHCVIEVSDEGKGFDPNSMNEEDDPDANFGLFSVRERLDLVSGELTIDSAPGEGTCARIEVPLST